MPLPSQSLPTKKRRRVFETQIFVPDVKFRLGGADPYQYVLEGHGKS
jgi:hypothetical protein